jgi:hypothetical protein
MSSVFGGEEDTTRGILGIGTGVFLVLAGIGTVIGAPWQTNGSGLLTAIQLLGVLGTIALGAGLVWLTRYEP